MKQYIAISERGDAIAIEAADLRAAVVAVAAWTTGAGAEIMRVYCHHIQNRRCVDLSIAHKRAGDSIYWTICTLYYSVDDSHAAAVAPDPDTVAALIEMLPTVD